MSGPWMAARGRGCPPRPERKRNLMPDDNPGDGSMWCEVCQEWVAPGYTDAHREQLPDAASRERLQEVMARLREQHHRAEN